MLIHIVAPGETVSGIAATYGVTAWQIIQDNQLTEPDRLTPGQNLLILYPAITHIVQKGDTLQHIAEQYAVDMISLYRNNYFLGGKPFIVPGQKLTISFRQPKSFRLSVNGYAYPFINMDLYQATLPYLTTVSIFAYRFTSDGHLLPLEDEQLLRHAFAMGVMPVMTVAPLNDDGFDSQLISDVLQNQMVSRRLMDEILAMVQEKNYGGVDLDFEYIRAEDSEAYVRFVQLLQQALQNMGKTLNIDLAPKTSSSQSGLLYEGQDYAALGEATDTALIMTYEWGYAYGPPGAVAPIDQVRAAMWFAISQIPREKLLMGIPNYGYDWPLPFSQGQNPAQSIANPQGVELAVNNGRAIFYDENAATPWFRYRDQQGREHEVWFEDPQSINAKLSLLRQFSLKGAGYWSLMRPFPQNWQMLNVLMDIERRDVSSK